MWNSSLSILITVEIATGHQPKGNLMSLWQHIDKVFKHKELQQQLMDSKLQRITEMMKEVEEKQQKERDFVSTSSFFIFCFSLWPVVWEKQNCTVAESMLAFESYEN